MLGIHRFRASWARLFRVAIGLGVLASAAASQSAVYPPDLPAVNVKTFYSAHTDGVNTQTAIANAMTYNANRVLYFPTGVYVIGSNLTLGACAFDPGAILKTASGGVTLTMNGPIYAGPTQQIVDTTSGGSVVWGGGVSALYTSGWTGGTSNVGVGTTTPSGLLSVGSGATSPFTVSSAGATNAYSLQTSSTTKTGSGGIEPEGSNSVTSFIGQANSTNGQSRFRLSRATPDSNGATDFLINPYSFGMGIEYPGLIEIWSNGVSFHNNNRGAVQNAGGQIWIDREDDGGGLHLQSWYNGGTLSPTAHTTIIGEKFDNTSSGPMKIIVRNSTDSFDFMSGAKGFETIKDRITGTGKVGINLVDQTVDPAAWLQVDNNMAFSDMSTANPMKFQTMASDGEEHLGFGAYYQAGVGNVTAIQASDYYSSLDHFTENLLLQPRGGMVGIGMTTTPNAMLDVNGGVRAKTLTLTTGYGTFGLSGSASTTVANSTITAISVISLNATNAAAATLMGSAKSLYISAQSAGASFTVTTANGVAPMGTETFSYVVVN